MWLSSKSLGPPIWPEGVQDTQSKTWHLPIIRRILHLPATANILPPATQKTVKSGKNAKNPTSSQKFISSRWKNSSLFLFVRLNCTMLPCKAPPALLPIGPRGPRLYFLLRRLHHAKFLKDITEITTQPKLTFLPYCWPYGGMGLSP